MGKRIAALVLIFVCTTIAWMILGTTILARTNTFDAELRNRVASIWGAPQTQAAPTAVLSWRVSRQVPVEGKGGKTTKTVEEKGQTNLLLERTRASVSFDLAHRQKGLLWYSTYKVDFAGNYTFRNTTDKAGNVKFLVAFPARNAVYDDLKLSVNGQPVQFTTTDNAAVASLPLKPGESAVLALSYRSQGLDHWAYQFDEGVAQVRDFVLDMRTNFKRIDFPDNTLAATDKHETGSGWDLTWRYTNVVTGNQIGMTMPQKLQPGPLAGKISFFAPVSLFFFFFVIFIVTTIRGIDIHPMNYFFLACAFFAFHLLMAYLVDHISIHAAFAICSVVSILLVTTYLRLVAGMRFALIDAGIAQFIYLVLFSYAFFFEGFTGLVITVGAIITLFIAMQMTGRIRWADKFQPKLSSTVAHIP